MDAQDLPRKSVSFARRLERILAIVLAVMCALGLWEGYGPLLGHVR